MVEVSVIMPAYNAEKFIKDAIESILQQTFKNFEFIIINDGSSDKTEEIILSYDDSRIKYIKNNTNLGIVKTLNVGLDNANGKYIVRMDADDISVDTRIEKLYTHMESNQNIGVLGSDICVFGEGIEQYVFEYSHSCNLAKAELMFNSSLAHPSVIIRKSILKDNNLKYEEEFKGLEDFVLWWRCSFYSEICSLDEVLLRYRKHKNQITKTRPEKFFKDFYSFCKERLDIFSLDFSKSEIDLFYKYCIGNYNEFSIGDLNMYIILLSKIIKVNNKKIIFSKYSLKRVSALSIIYIMKHINLNKIDKIKYIFYSFAKGVMPIDIFAKILVILMFRS